MEKSVQITLIIVGAVLILAMVGFSFISNLMLTNTVTGDGEAVLGVTPDLVSVYFNVETKGDTATEARDDNAEILDDLIVKLLKLRFERKDIQTQNFNVYQDYKWDGRTQKEDGWKAVHSVRVEMSTEDADKIGDVIDAGVDAGALISYINFELSQELQNTYKAEALKLATQDAQIKAEAVADGLGKKLGNLVSVKTSQFNYNPWMLYESVGSTMDAETAKTTTTNIQPGEQDVRASVSVVYKLR